MTSDWVARNLLALSLHIGASVLVLAACLALFRVRAPLARLRMLELWLALACTLSPMVSLMDGRRSSGSVSPAHVEERIEASAAPARVIPAPAMPLAHLIVGLWIGGAVCRAAWLVAGYRRFRRRRTVAPPPALEREAEELRELASPGVGFAPAVWKARIEWCADLKQPGTIGLFPPRVLLPAALIDDDPVRRRAILCHELIHVRRADWHAVLIEELARTVFWFHPGVRWVVAETRVAREQVIDQEVVERLGNRDAYLNLLYDYATEAPAMAAAAPFFGRHQLERRVRSLLMEVRMSRLHRFAAIWVTTAAAGAVVGAATHVYPLNLVVPSSAQDQASTPGPLEQTATEISGKNVLPNRVHVSPFTFPAEARAALSSGLVTLRVVVDNTGTVAEARVLRTKMTWLPSATPADTARVTGLISEQAMKTVREWRYDPPPTAVAWTLTVFYTDGRTVREAEGEAAETLSADRRPLRVGGPVGPPKKLVHVAPAYPPAALDAGIEGVVIIEVTIDPAGAVSDARVLRSVPELDDAALEAVRQWKYSPTLLNGAPVPVIATVTIDFSQRKR